MSETAVEYFALSSKCRDEFKNIIADFDEHHVIFRLWAKDATLFTSQDEASMLDWLDEPNRLQKSLASLKEIKNTIEKRNTSSTFLLGMGGSSLSVRVFQSILAPHTINNFFVVDTIHPATLARLEQRCDVKKTLFIVASKSGSTLEPELLYRYFLSLLEHNAVKEPYQHFMAITDAKTPLLEEALAKGFLPGPVGKSGIGGRYSALSVFGIVPAMLMNVDVDRLLLSAVSMAQDCGPSIIAPNNPVAVLAAFIAANFKNGKDQIVFHISSTFHDFGLWLEQLIAESLGKNGTGLVPIIDYGDGIFNNNVSAHVVIQYRSDQKINADFADVFFLPVDDIYQIGGLMFRFECAVALLAYVLKVNPFNQPDVEKSKILAREIIDKIKNGQTILEEQATRISGLSIFPDIKQFFSRVFAGDYFAILSYLDDTDDNFQKLRQLHSLISQKYSANVMIEIGPRYLHSTGQLFKGGKNNGHFLVITGAYKTDRVSDVMKMSFSDLHRSQAFGDILAMKNCGRSVLHVDIHQQNLEELTTIIANI